MSYFVIICVRTLKLFAFVFKSIKFLKCYVLSFWHETINFTYVESRNVYNCVFQVCTYLWCINFNLVDFAPLFVGTRQPVCVATAPTPDFTSENFIHCDVKIFQCGFPFLSCRFNSGWDSGWPHVPMESSGPNRFIWNPDNFRIMCAKNFFLCPAVPFVA